MIPKTINDTMTSANMPAALNNLPMTPSDFLMACQRRLARNLPHINPIRKPGTEIK
jgi:hypothetical protein